MSSNKAPPPPNYQPLADAQLQIAQMQKESAGVSEAFMREQYEWAKQAYAENKGVTDRVVEAFLDTQEVNARNAAADRERYESIYQPLEDDLAREAREYASPERKELEMGRAAAQVAQQFGAARVSAQRDLEAFGINPGATRFAALDIGTRAQQAAASAGAANQAGQQVDAVGRALRSEAINVGKGYPGQIAGQYGTALQSGSGAGGQALATTASGGNTMGTAPQYGALANNSLTGASSSTAGAANALNMGYNNTLAGWKAGQEASSGWGSALGLIGGMATKFIPGFDDGGAVGDGGLVPKQVSPSRGQAVDDVEARLSPGEFIVDAETVKFKGTEFFHKLKIKSREALAELENESGAVPTVHPSAMGAPGGAGRRQALEVA
jgi:hypothetical protein